MALDEERLDQIRARAVHAFCHAVPNTWHQMGVLLSAAASLAWWSGVVGIDEAQFLSPAQVRQLHRFAHGPHGVPVLCYGLRSDFRGEAFPGSAALLTLADDLEEMKTICACARKASMNLRIDAAGRRVQSGEQVLIGGNERYRAVCPRCFYGDDAGAPDQAPGLFG